MDVGINHVYRNWCNSLFLHVYYGSYRLACFYYRVCSGLGLGLGLGLGVMMLGGDVSSILTIGTKIE